MQKRRKVEEEEATLESLCAKEEEGDVDELDFEEESSCGEKEEDDDEEEGAGDEHEDFAKLTGTVLQVAEGSPLE